MNTRIAVCCGLILFQVTSVFASGNNVSWQTRAVVSRTISLISNVLGEADSEEGRFPFNSEEFVSPKIAEVSCELAQNLKGEKITRVRAVIIARNVPLALTLSEVVEWAFNIENFGFDSTDVPVEVEFMPDREFYSKRWMILLSIFTESRTEYHVDYCFSASCEVATISKFEYDEEAAQIRRIIEVVNPDNGLTYKFRLSDQDFEYLESLEKVNVAGRYIEIMRTTFFSFDTSGLAIPTPEMLGEALSVSNVYGEVYSSAYFDPANNSTLVKWKVREGGEAYGMLLMRANQGFLWRSDSETKLFWYRCALTFLHQMSTVPPASGMEDVEELRYAGLSIINFILYNMEPELLAQLGYDREQIVIRYHTFQ